MMTHTPALTTPGAEVVIENESKAVDDNCYVSHNLNSNQSWIKPVCMCLSLSCVSKCD